MTTTKTIRNVRPAEAAAQVAACINSYEPQLLTAGQRELMLADIKAVALATQPPSRAAAGNMLSTLCRFVVDLAPSAGCPLDEVLTEVQIARWVANKKAQPKVPRTLTTNIGRLRQALRSQAGMPPRVKSEIRRKVGVPPLPADQYQTLRSLALFGPAPLARAFATAFGAGLPASSAGGGQFERRDDRIVLVLPNGTVRAVLAETVTNGLIDTTVDPSDWDALVDVAARELRCRVDAAVAHQTFRERAFAQPLAAADIIRDFDLRPANLDALIDFLAPVDIATDSKAHTVLRG